MIRNNLLLFLLLSITPGAWSQQAVTSKTLEGTWKMVMIEVDQSELHTEEVRFPDDPQYNIFTPNEHWVFRKDSVFKVDYPCSRFSKRKYTVNNGMLSVLPEGERAYPNDVYTANFQWDTLVLSSIMIGAGTSYLVRDTLPKTALDRLMKGLVNPECLYGDWEIPVGEVSVPYDAIVVSYPWTLPDTITVSASNLHWYWAKNRFYLEVDGKKRPFRVERASLTEEDLYLIPEKWVEEYIKKYDLDPYQVGHVWLRRVEDED